MTVYGNLETRSFPFALFSEHFFRGSIKISGDAYLYAFPTDFPEFACH
jgi:hypothetical protein